MTQVDELKFVNPDLLQRYGLGSIDQLRQQEQQMASMDFLMMQRKMVVQQTEQVQLDKMPTMQEVQLQMLRNNAAGLI